MHASAARAPRGGRERRVSLRKPVVVRRDRRTAYPHSGGRLDGPIGFPKAHPSLPPGERAVRVRTETLPPSATLAVARRRRYGRRVRVPTSRTAMPMMRARPTAVLLVRHGTTPTTGLKLPGRAPGLHLSDEGRGQADAAAARIASLRRVSAVYASAVDRARETA